MVLQNNRCMGYFYRGLLTALLSMCMFSGVAAANVKKITGFLNLSATVNNQPAFSAVSWRINLTAPGVNRLVRELSKHAATVELEPGEYQITLTVGSKREIRTITIVESKQHNLVINVRKGGSAN